MNYQNIIDKYYGEFYDEKLRIDQIAENANKYKDGCKLVNFGKFARYCSVELHTANCTSGFFMSMSASTFKNEIDGDIGISYLDFTKGRLNDNGELDSTISRWFTTDKFFEIGRSTLQVNGVNIQIYDKERMLIELIRNRKSIGFDYYKEIISNYREIKDTLNTKKIAEYISKFATQDHLYDVIMKEVF